MSKITSYAQDTAPAGNNILLEVDVSDTSMAGTGTDKQVTVAALGRVITGWADLVRDYGADSTGAAACDTALTSMTTAATAAQPQPFGVTVPPGFYKVAANHDLPYNLILRGAGQAGGDVTGQYIGSVFQVASSFSGSYAFGFRDTPHVSGMTGTNGAIVSGIYLDGGAYTGGSAVDGFYVYGPTMCTFTDIKIARMSGWAVNASGGRFRHERAVPVRANLD